MKNMRIFSMYLFLTILGTSSLLAQGLSISGKVLDQTTKETVIGATVMVVGTQDGTVTDFDGNFQLSTSSTNPKLEVRYVGYQTLTVAAQTTGQTVIYLVEDSEALDEVVVIGYGVQKKSDLTGSISSVKGSDIASLASTNVVSALQGKASGVEIVQNSGSPGSSASIRIRGMGTVNDSDPLYVVDGVSLESIDYLSSDDIESIEILKDASSAAIYGSRAANGVVLITTKSGANSNGQVKVNISGYYGTQSIIKEPNLLSAEQYMVFSDYVSNTESKTVYDEAAGAYVARSADELASSTDWWDEVSQQGESYKLNLSLTGGTKDLNYYFSGNFLGSTGIVKTSGYERQSFNAKINAKLTNKITLGASVTYSLEHTDNVLEGQYGVIKKAISYNPLTDVYDTSGNYTWGTPTEVLRRSSYDVNKGNLLSQLNLNWQLADGLLFTSRGSFTSIDSETEQFSLYNKNEEVVNDIIYIVTREPATTQNMGWDNVISYNNTFGKHSLSAMAGQTLETCTYEVVSITGTGYGGYDEAYDAINFATQDQSASGYTTGWTALGLLGRVSYDYDGRYLAQANFRADASSRFSEANRWGYFPSLSLGWKLNEESFLKNQDWITLLKLRAGWGQLGNNRIGNYEYADLVVAASENYIYGSGTPTQEVGMSITNYGNEDIKWEWTESYTLGLDFNMLSNKITTSFDLFLKDTHDMLLEVPVVYSSGWSSSPMQNAGSVRNIGAEIQASYRGSVGAFRYEVGGNISFVQNEVTSLGEYNEPLYGGDLASPNDLGYVTKTEVGSPIACFYGYKTDGLLQASDFDENGNCLVATPSATTGFSEGDMKFVDINGDNTIDENDMTYIGSPHPDYYYGININLGYKSFDLTAFFSGVQGNSIYNATKYYLYSPVSSGGVWQTGTAIDYSNVATDYFDVVYRPEVTDGSSSYRDYWGSNTSGTVPAPSTSASINESNFRNSDFYIEDGSYLRLKNIQLNYTLPKEYCAKVGMSGVKFYISATNLFTITSYSGLDPEIGKQSGTESNNLSIGIDQGTYPTSKTYLFGFILDI